MTDKPLVQVFPPDHRQGLPNSKLPLVLRKGLLPEDARNGERACALFEKNRWTGSWVYTVYPFWHFHTKGHEVLACVAGRAVLGFGGGAHGLEVEVEPGDVCLVPAGAGHKRVRATDDFRVAGAYPSGQEGDINAAGDMEITEAEVMIAKVPLPESDPVMGSGEGGLIDFWKGAGD